MPVGAGRLIEIVLEHFEPVSREAIVQLDRRPGKPIDQWNIPRFFRGRAQDVVVLLVDRRSTIEGFVETREGRFAIRATGDVDPLKYILSPIPNKHTLPRCYTPAAVESSLAPTSQSGLIALNGYSGPLRVDLAIDASVMVYNYFESSEVSVVFYSALIVAAHSLALYYDSGITAQMVFLHIWTDSSMPYSQGAIDYEIPFLQFQEYWNANLSLINRDAAILLWNINDGGIAQPKGVCHPLFGYGLADVQPTLPYQYGAFGHELGHVLGAGHTHCASPPEDFCGNDFGLCTRRCAGGQNDREPCNDGGACPGGTCPVGMSCPSDALEGPGCSSDVDCRLCHLSPLAELPEPGGTLMSNCGVRQLTYGPSGASEIGTFASTEQAACLRTTFDANAMIGEDTFVVSSLPTTNEGNQPTARWGRGVGPKGGSPILYRGLLFVDLNDYISAAIPVRAILSIYVETMALSSGLAAPRIKIDRSEGFIEEGVTWASFPLRFPDPEVSVSFVVTGSGWIEINVTTLVQRCWNNESGVCSWAVLAENEVDNTTSWVDVRSSEYSDPTYRPLIEVEYADL